MFTFDDLFARCSIMRPAATAMAVPAAALALCAGQATGQDLEWEPDEGYHEEEWYDPSDWFDDDTGIDYENDWYETGWYNDYYYGGYYDAYYDDEYGYDYWDADWDSEYSDAYTTGYYDGYYDQMYDYDYDPYYYIYSVDVPQDQMQDQQGQQDQQVAQQGQRQRQEDRTRQRGDRLDRQARDDRKAQQHQASMQRIRGTVTAVAEAEGVQRENHTVLRIGFEDRQPLIVDFGPQMTRDQMPLEQGDRATLIGRMEQRDSEKVLVVSKIIEGGEAYTLRGPAPDQQEGKREGNQRQREGR